MKSFADYLSRGSVLVQLCLTTGALALAIVAIYAVRAIEASRAIVLY